MRSIAMISYHTCPLASEEGKETGGMNVYVLELSKHLARLGYSVDIFTRSVDPSNKPVVVVQPGLRVIHLIAGEQTVISKKNLVPYIPRFVDQVRNFMKMNRVDYDAVHCHYYLSGLIGVQLQKLLQVPLIISFHTLALMKNLVARTTEEKEDIFRIEKESELSVIADSVIATSQYDADYLRFLYETPEEKIHIILPGVDTKVFHPIDKNTAKKMIRMSEIQKMILFSGRIEPLKGIDVLIYAIKIVTSRNPHIPLCLCIVGGDISQSSTQWTETLQSLDNVRKLLHMKTNVHFVGQQHQHMLPYYYNAAEVVVMPSHYESFGMTALEAMACGAPVITTNVAGVSSILDEKHANLITTVSNPLLLASQIESLVLHPEKRDTIGISLQRHVRDLTWTRTAKGHAEVYDHVIKGGHI